MNISTEPSIISLANSLELYTGDPVVSIREYCREKLKTIVNKVDRVLSMDHLEELVCDDLNLKVHRVWSDLELQRLSDSYVEKGELVFLALSQQLSSDVYGIFIKLTNPCSDSGAPWVSVIDCRGDKEHKRHWTFWHEVAHCLMAVKEMQLPLRRSLWNPKKIQKEPIEVLTDYLAKDLAFYAPIFDPLLNKELANNRGELSFSVVNTVRRKFTQEASFLSTLITCVERYDKPCLLVEAKMGFSKKEQQENDIETGTHNPSLRIVNSIPNDFMRNLSLFLPKNYRVPLSSVICEAKIGTPTVDCVENFQNWSDSRGHSLRPMEILVSAKKAGDSVYAIIRPTKDTHPT